MQLFSHPEEHVSLELSRLCARVVDYLGIEYEPSHIIFDNNDYLKIPDIIDEFRDAAFFWTPERPKNKVPLYLGEIMSDPKCTHLIWLSHSVLSSSDMSFVWVLAHELRHVFQSRNEVLYGHIKRKIREIRREQYYFNLPSFLFDPSEIDAELCALRTLEDIYNEGAQVFLDAGSLRRCPLPQYAQLLKRVSIECLN
ncbi:MAG TPA: hypothetical protein ENJ28_05645 [Gammaproteobacteria bacterium]|nr:hypothetical protein [Gammaproteobacteria bacterium]